MKKKRPSGRFFLQQHRNSYAELTRASKGFGQTQKRSSTFQSVGSFPSLRDDSLSAFNCVCAGPSRTALLRRALPLFTNRARIMAWRSHTAIDYKEVNHAVESTRRRRDAPICAQPVFPGQERDSTRTIQADAAGGIRLVAG